MHSERDQDLVDVLAEEFLKRRQNGEDCGIEEYVEKHPDRADDIRDVFAALDFVRANQPLSDEIPQIPDYEIIREIGRGGMGIVYEARQISLGRRVALKVVPQTLLDNELSVKRFELEARTAAQLEHDNIVPVFDFGFKKRLNYFSMKLVEGKGLDDVIGDVRTILKHSGDDSSNRSKLLKSLSTNKSSGSLSRALQPNSDTKALCSQTTAIEKSDSLRIRSYYHNAANICRQVADALSYAHQNNVVHRDIKPSNLLLDHSGKVWVADFGLAKTESQDLTTTGNIVGTLRFMSPERLEGINDRRSDIYSLGMTLYELLSLQPAFQNTNPMKVLEKIRDHSPPHLSTIDSGIPIDLQTIVEKSIEKDPRKRYQTAAALSQDLQLFLQGRPIKARRVSQAEHAFSWARRNPGIAGSLAAVFFLLVSGLIGSTYMALVFQDMAQEQRRLVKVADEESELRAQELYYAQMHLANDASNTSVGLERLRELVNNWIPDNHDEKDRRGFEWYWLASKSDWDKRHLNVNEVGPTLLNWSEQGGTVSWSQRGFTPLFDYMDRPRNGACINRRFNRDGTLFGVMYYDHPNFHSHQLEVWDCQQKNIVFENKDIFRNEKEWIQGFDFNPADDQLIVIVRTRENPKAAIRSTIQFRIYSTTTWECIHSSPDINQHLSEKFRRVRFHDDGSVFAFCHLPNHPKKPTVECFNTNDWASVAKSEFSNFGALAKMDWHPEKYVLAGFDQAGQTFRWDVDSGMTVWLENERFMNSIHWHPKTHDLIISGNGALRVHDEVTLARKHLFPISNDGSVWCGSSPDGSEMLVADRLETSLIDFVQAPVRTLSHRQPGHGSKDYELKWSPDEKLISGSNGNSITVWDLERGRRFAADNQRTILAGQPLGWDSTKQLMTASGSHLCIWDQFGLELAMNFDVQKNLDLEKVDGLWKNGPIKQIEIHDKLSDGNILIGAYLGDKDYGLAIWDPNESRHTFLFQAASRQNYPMFRAVAVSEDETIVAISIDFIGTHLVNVKTGDTRVIIAEDGVYALAWSKDNRLAAAKQNGQIQIFDADSGEVVTTCSGGEGWVTDLDWSPDGKRIASGSRDRRMRIWDTQTGNSTLVVEMDSLVGAVSFSPSGKQLASLTKNGNLRIWDARRGYKFASTNANASPSSNECLGGGHERSRNAILTPKRSI